AHPRPALISAKRLGRLTRGAPFFLPNEPALDLGDYIFQFLRYLEDRNAAGRNRHRFARPWIPGEAGLAILHLERAEATDLDVLACGQSPGDSFQELIDRVGHVLLGKPRALRDFVDDFCLGHQRLLKRVPSARPGGSEPSRAKTKGAPRSA